MVKNKIRIRDMKNIVVFIVIHLKDFPILYI